MSICLGFVWVSCLSLFSFQSQHFVEFPITVETVWWKISLNDSSVSPVRSISQRGGCIAVVFRVIDSYFQIKKCNLYFVGHANGTAVILFSITSFSFSALFLSQWWHARGYQMGYGSPLSPAQTECKLGLQNVLSVFAFYVCSLSVNWCYNDGNIFTHDWASSMGFSQPLMTALDSMLQSTLMDFVFHWERISHTLLVGVNISFLNVSEIIKINRSSHSSCAFYKDAPNAILLKAGLK